MVRNFDIDALRTMVVGVEFGNFARAASELGRSQSAISMHIKKLEDRTGKALFTRQGRGLIPTEAGDQLLYYARKIIALNDEAAIALGVGESGSSVKLGLPQDFFDAILPQTMAEFSSETDNIHIDVRAGRNYALEEEVQSGRIDVAIAFFPKGSKGHGEFLLELPTYWFAASGYGRAHAQAKRLPLVMFDHPCLFRTNALKALKNGQHLWRVALTTPSLPGVWSGVQARQGITSRIAYRAPEGLERIHSDIGLPATESIEIRLLVSDRASPATLMLRDVLKIVALRELSMTIVSAT